MNLRKALMVCVLLAAVGAFFAFGLHREFGIESLQARQAELAAAVAARPAVAVGAYFAAYVAITALSLPGALVMTLAGGALFGFWAGLFVVSFASTIGATLAMLVARFLLRDWARARLGTRLDAIDAGIAREGGFYLFALRLVPLFPFFVINLAMGLTRLPTRTFYWVSQLGMLPATLVFVNLGTQLSRLESLRGLLSPALLVSFALLGLLPLAARRIVAAFKARKAYARWPRPSRFNYNLVVIGAGSGGLVASYIAAATQARVALVERERMGGDCLNTGCVPSKALIRSGRFVAHLARGAEFGVRAQGEVDFAAVMARVQATIRAIEPHDSVARYTELGVDCMSGTAKLVSPWVVEVNGSAGQRRLTTREIVIATGARPYVPPLPGLDEDTYYTSDTIWSLRALPRRLLVLGGGPIGCELAQAFARLGASVTVVEQGARLLAREDEDVATPVAVRFAAERILVYANCKALRVETVDDGRRLVAQYGSEEIALRFDALLVAVGRVPNVTGLGLEALGVDVIPDRVLAVDEFLATSLPNVYACGDVIGPFQFTHVSAHQAWYAAVNALFGRFRRFRADYRVIPRATFTEPEVARVGLNEMEARDQGVAYEVTRYGFDDLDRAIADGDTEGFVKVLTPPGSDRILGVSIVGAHAAELLAEFTLAMKHGLGLRKLLGTIHPYPSFSEANKYAAGVWQRRQVTLGQQRVLRAFQAWQRGQHGIGGFLASLPALITAKKRVADGE